MKDSIKQIFKQNILISVHIDRAINYFRVQNFDIALQLVAVSLEQIGSCLNKIAAQLDYFNNDHLIVDINYISSILESLLEGQKIKDYILLADMFEGQLQPMILTIQGYIMDKEGYVLDHELYLNNITILNNRDLTIDSYTSVEELLQNIDEGYSIEYTSIGQYTLAIEDKSNKYYFHSNNGVSKEALQLANSWYTEDKSNYIIYGLGFGYHIGELFGIDKNINIEVYESDINIIQLACAFSNIGQVLSKPNITLIYDPDFVKLSNRMKILSNDDELLIHYPSLRNIKNPMYKEYLENYFLQYSSIKNQLRLLNGNFRKNISCDYDFVDELSDKFKGKDVYIVAAGPSLDKNYLYLKELRQKSDSIILATGTVYRKLLNAGIRPDYFIVTDANERVYAQIRGLENETIPMLFLSTAYHGFASNYKGDKYIILQYEYDKSEKYAKEKGVNLYKTGGSVSTTALDIGITLGCKRIVFLGLDLAFTDNFVHATNTSRRELASTDDLRQVEDINGELVYTSKSLDIYRKWIENRIMDVKDIEIIDATEGGAKIKGMKIVKLSDVINNKLK